MRSRTLLAVALCSLALGLTTAPADAAEPVNKTLFGKLAVGGYDAVAYFTDGQPVKGMKEFTHEWQGATWRFASAAHRDAFAAEPEAYAPQYGGYCAWAVSQGYTADADPEAWTVVDGKLYLNYNAKVKADWSQDMAGNIAKADANWPAVLEK
jgi:YHS domain-containing protein